MKKVLVATCVMAMAAFGITNASADPAQTTRAGAFGIELSSSLLSGGGGGTDALVDRTGEAASTLPPGGPDEDDVLTVGDTGELALSGTGKALADTRVESTIRPILNPENEQSRGGSTEGSGLLGGELLGGILGGGEGGPLGGGEGGTLGGLGGIGALSEGEPGTVQAQQLGDDGFLGGLLEGDGLLGGILGESGEDESGNRDPNIIPSFANAQGYAVVENLGVANDDVDSLLGNLVGSGLTETAAQALVDALLKVEAVQAEAVVICNGTQPIYDTASRLVDLNNEGVNLVDDLVATIADILPGIITVNQTGRTADGGVFVNALRVTVGGDDLLGGGDDTVGGIDDTVGGIDDTVGGIDDTVGGIDDTVGGTTDTDGGTTDTGVGTESFQAQQLGDDGALIDLIVGHAEVGGTVCAQQAAPPAPLVPTGPGDTLPVTGGGLGVLPVVLGIGLAGAAVGAGGLALRARRENTL